MDNNLEPESVNWGKNTIKYTVKLINSAWTRGIIVFLWIVLLYCLILPSYTDLDIEFENSTQQESSKNCDQRAFIDSIPPSEEYTFILMEKLNCNQFVFYIQNESGNIDSQLQYNSCNSSYDSDHDILSNIADNPHSLVTLAILVAFSALLGYFSTLIYFPSLLGMLVAGIIFTHIPKELIGEYPADIPRNLSSALRGFALAIILARGGLGISPKALKSRAIEVLALAFTPCLIEMCVISLSTFVIIGIRWEWACMAGGVVAAVSPAVVVPFMLNLQANGYGTEKGIPTMIMAASSFDDVLAISLFFIFVSVGFSQANIIFTIFRGPLELTLGLFYGMVFGFIGWSIAIYNNSEEKGRNRLMYMLGTALLSIFGSQKLRIYGSTMSGAGALGTITTGLLCSIGWREEKGNVELALKIIWQLGQPLLFGLIGYELNFYNSSFTLLLFAKIMLILMIGLSIRTITTFLIVLCAPNMNLKEKLFVPLAWLPKATVQAAVGSIALDLARTSEEKDLGLIVLYIAVFSIILTAPIGAILINIFGTKLLSKSLNYEGVLPQIENNTQSHTESFEPCRESSMIKERINKIVSIPEKQHLLNKSKM